MTLPNVEALLSAPRGRGLCLAIAGGVDEQVHSAWSQAAWQPGNDRLLDNLVQLLADIDPSPIPDWTDPLAFADPMDLTVSSAMGWQEPHPEDVISRAAPVVAALGPIGEAVVSAPGARWWPTAVDLDALRYTSRFDRHDKLHPPVDPTLGDTTTRLERWRAAEMQTNQRDRRLLSADPAANYSGHWWSIPALSGLIATTRQLPRLGAIKLIWEEDSPGDADDWDGVHLTVIRLPDHRHPIAGCHRRGRDRAGGLGPRPDLVADRHPARGRPSTALAQPGRRRKGLRMAPGATGLRMIRLIGPRNGRPHQDHRTTGFAASRDHDRPHAAGPTMTPL
ncbi:hypothetical protein [Microlunatus endophyticus]|uniref:hypothetical protein n=1 Tax=Microlunatus endophyticus TaxID=1716077 RepID=UPI001E4F3CA9|nr:hypothetical protein [Microlunatus endophyticus]